MAVNKPDIYQHNNPNNAFVDSTFVRGGGRVVPTLTGSTGLYGLTGKTDQLSEHITRVWVESESKYYILTDMLNVGNVSGWTIDTVDLSGHLPLTGGTLTGGLTGTTLTLSGGIKLNNGNISNNLNITGSNFIGNNAGYAATGSTNSNFFGYYAGYNARNSNDSNFLGLYAGINAVSANNSNFLGNRAGNTATNADNSNFLGANAGESATSAYQSNFLGQGAGSNSTNARFSNFLGQNAGAASPSANNSNFLGSGAGYQATSASQSNFFGNSAGYQATNAYYSNFFGNRAGFLSTNANYSNFFGYYAGNGASNSSYSSLIGYNVGLKKSGNGIGPNNIIIGTNVSLPNDATNSMNLGGVLFGTGLYFNSGSTQNTGTTAGARIGVNVINPTEMFDVSGYTKSAGFKVDGTVGYLKSDGTVDVNSYLTGYTETNPGVYTSGQTDTQIDTKRKLLACGPITEVVVSGNTNGVVNISSINANFNTVADFTGNINTFTVPALNGLQLVANQYLYITAQYNNGNPQYVTTTDNNIINHSTILNIVQLYWENINDVNEIHVFYTGTYGLGLSNKIGHRLLHTERFGYESGLILGEYGTRNISISSGRLWYDGEEIDTLEVNTATAGHETHFYYPVGGVFNVSKVTQYPNNQYSNGTNLVNLTGNKYTSVFVWKCVNSTDRCSFIMVGGEYNSIADALVAKLPSVIPDVIVKQGKFIGRIVIQNNQNTASQITNELTASIGQTPVTNHNSLSNIQGGTTDEYYHLTNNQVNNINNLETTYLALTGGTLTGKLGSTISENFLTGTTNFRQYEGNLTRYTGNTSTVTEGIFENVSYSGTTNVSGLYGINLYTRNLNSATVSNLYGVQSYARNDGSGKSTNIVGGYFSTRNNTTGSFNKMLGVQSVMTNNSSDVTNNDMYGVSASMTNGSTGFTDSMAGITSYIYNNGTINEATGLGVYFPAIGAVNSTIYGVKIGSSEHPWVGSSPNMYGLYIHSTVTGGTVNNYGIYSDTTAKNYLKGGLGVKMSPTNDALSVSGDTLVYGNITGSTFVKSGGTSNQFLKADGSVDSNIYSLTGHTHYQLYQPDGTNPFVYTDNNKTLNIISDGVTGNTYLLNVKGNIIGGNQLGTIPTGYKAMFFHEMSNYSSSQAVGLNAWMEWNHTVNTSQNYYGGWTISETMTGSTANYTGTIYGLTGSAIHRGSGTATNLIGVYGISRIGTPSNNGNITNSYAGKFMSYNQGSGTITNNYGVSIFTPTNTGTITNNYGLYIQDQSIIGSTLSYNLYSAGSGKSYFSGNMGIGTLPTSNYKLEVSGNTNISGNLTATSFITSGGTSNDFVKGDGSLDSNVYSKEPISITYSDLYNLVTTSGLTVGQRYIINDYQTVHTIPNTSDTNTGQVEPLLVEALTISKLKNECYSTLFPEDIIYYDIENNQTMIPGCIKGYIYRRVDTIKNNDIGFDYRNVKFRRWQIEVTTEEADGDNNTYYIGSIVKKTGTNEIYLKINNTQGLFTDTNKWKRFEWNNLQYVSPTEGMWSLDSNYFYLTVKSNYVDYYMFSTEPTVSGVQSSYDNISGNYIVVNNIDILYNNDTVFFGGNISYNTIGGSFYSNTIGYGFNYNTIGDNFNYNSIGNIFYSNTIGNFFYSNTIGSNFNNNGIGNNFYSNTIGDNFYSNTIGDNFNSNTIGIYFYSNTIENNFNYNTIGNYFGTNTIGWGFNSNTIGSNFNTNTIGNYFNSNTIGNGFYSNTIRNDFNNNTIGNDFNYNTIGSNFNTNTIGNGFNNNTIGSEFNYNGGLDLTSSTYVYQGYNKELFTNSNNMQYLKYYDENNVLQIVQANL